MATISKKRPYISYQRPQRDCILSRCQLEQRLPTEEEIRAVSQEGLAMAKAGYPLSSILEEDSAAITAIVTYIGTVSGEDDGSEEGPELRYKPLF